MTDTLQRRGAASQEVALRFTDTLTGAGGTHLDPLGTVWSTVADTEAPEVCDGRYDA